MTFSEWLFDDFNNPPIQGQWKLLHILTMLISIAFIFAFYYIVKYSKNKEKTRKIILFTLVSLILLFEIVSRVVYIIKKYSFNSIEMVNHSLVWILLPKPWCAISCWALMASVLVNKKFFYNYASLSALLCSVIFFIYPGVGFNNEYILFSNLYSIVTHALLLTTSITLITLKFTEFKYENFYKLAICFVLTYVYGILQIYVLQIHHDPMYFMPNGDIQAGILQISYGLYLFAYILLIIIYVNAFYLIQDKTTVKNFFNKVLKK